MKNVLKWAMLALVVLEAALVWFRVIDIRTAIGIVVTVELLLFLLTLRQVVVAVRTYRQQRLSGTAVRTAFENGLDVFLPRAVARVLSTEVLLWYYLGAWLLRRVPRDAGSFSYHRKSILVPFIILLLFTTPAEVFLFGLLVPWVWVKWVLAVTAIYAFFWVAGLYATLVMLPHRLGEVGILVNYGVLAHVEVPYREIEGVVVGRVAKGLRGDGLKTAKEDGAAYMSVGGTTDIAVRLRTPQLLHGWLRATPPVTTLHIAADEPERLVLALSARMAARPPLTSKHPGV